MRKQWVVTLVVGAVALLWAAGCKKNTIPPDAPEPVLFTVPAGWPAPVYSFANNPLTAEGFALGKKLFYDPILSRDNTISCGTCHQQFAAFANLDHPVSHGINDLVGNRNSPTIFNLAWMPSFFWDGGVNNLESQPLNPIENHVEMDLRIGDAVAKLQANAAYQAHFQRVFGDGQVTTQRLFRALAQFMGAIVSADAKYDRYTRGEATFTAEELNGLAVFRKQCASCHAEPLFTDYSFRNNGLAPNMAVNDSGRAHITRNPADLYRFKVPSLRNVAASRPYMHDGRIATLAGVLQHYRTGVTASPTLDHQLSGGIALTDQEQKDIISFLETLTDSTYLNDPRFAEPAP